MSNRFAQMAKSVLPGVAGAMPPRPPKLAAPPPKAAPAMKASAKAAGKPVAPKPRRDLSANLGKHLHPRKAR